jgi:hypothetical protein
LIFWAAAVNLPRSLGCASSNLWDFVLCPSALRDICEVVHITDAHVADDQLHLIFAPGECSIFYDPE